MSLNSQTAISGQPNPAEAIPKVSVVIPAWNRRDKLRASVESVLRQTFQDFELIVVDDGSTDGTLGSIADIADPRLRTIAHDTNRGVSAARNTGMYAARAQWIAFNDSDDEWLPLKLEKQMALHKAIEPTIIASHTGIIHVSRPKSGSGRTSISYSPNSSRANVEGHLTNHLLRASDPYAFIQTMIVRRDAAISIGGFDENMAGSEDREFNYRLMGKGKFLFLDEPLTINKQSENSITRDASKIWDGREYMMNKHLDSIISTCPEAVTRHHIIYAGMKRRLGDIDAARHALRAAAQINPYEPTIRLRQLRLLIGSLWKKN